MADWMRDDRDKSITFALATLRAEHLIIKALKSSTKDGMSGIELSKATGLWAGTLYPALALMERTGKLKSAWVDGPYPRRRLYHLVSEES